MSFLHHDEVRFSPQILHLEFPSPHFVPRKSPPPPSFVPAPSSRPSRRAFILIHPNVTMGNICSVRTPPAAVVGEGSSTDMMARRPEGLTLDPEVGIATSHRKKHKRRHRGTYTEAHEATISPLPPLRGRRPAPPRFHVPRLATLRPRCPYSSSFPRLDSSGRSPQTWLCPRE